MKKKLYMTPLVEEMATENEALLEGSIKIDGDGEGGSGSLVDEEVDIEGKARLLLFLSVFE